MTLVDDPTPSYDELKVLTKVTHQYSRSSADFHPARQEDARLLAAVLRGDHIAQGFRNQDIRLAHFGNVQDAMLRRPHSVAIGRMLKRLYVRGLVKKVPQTRHWRVTDLGRRILGDILRTYHPYSVQVA